MTEEEARDTLDRFEANLFHDLYRSRWNPQYAAGVVPPLRECLASSDVEILRRTLSALHRIGPEAYEAAAEVLPMLTHPEPKLRESAVWALAGISLRQPETAIPHLLVTAKAHPKLLRPIMMALIGFGPKAISSIPLFLKAFESADSRQRLLAIRGLKEIGPDFIEIEEILRRGLSDRSKDVRLYVQKLLKNRWPAQFDRMDQESE